MKGDLIFDLSVKVEYRALPMNVSFGKGELDWSVGISNLLNKVYSEHLDWGNYHRQGRNLSLDIGLRF